MLATRIVSLEVQELNIALREPFGIAGGAQEQASNLLVTVRLEGGAIGIGEAAPFPAFNGETQDLARQATLQARSVVEGRDARSWRSIARDLIEATGNVGSARCAIETALLDALCRHIGLPLWSLFGGASQQLETDITITTGSADEARAAAARVAAEGFRDLKIKVGAGSVEVDVARVVAACEAASPRQLVLDGNAGLSATAALDLLRLLAAKGIKPALFEQPCAGSDIEGLYRVLHDGQVRVAADESLTGERSAAALARAGAVDVFNLKLMKHGIAEAVGIAAIARSFGIGLMIGGMVESVLAMTTSACVAAGIGGFGFVDLDTPLFLASNPFEGGFVQQGPLLDLSSIEAGHGVRLK